MCRTVILLKAFNCTEAVNCHRVIIGHHSLNMTVVKHCVTDVNIAVTVVIIVIFRLVTFTLSYDGNIFTCRKSRRFNVTSNYYNTDLSFHNFETINSLSH